MNTILARLWRLGKPVQWRFLWLMHAKFICGITGVIRDGDGRVLLLRHRLWPESRQWGFPTGYAKYRIEVYYEATLTGGLDSLTLDSREILDARLFSPDELPDSMPDNHRELAARLTSEGSRSRRK